MKTSKSLRSIALCADDYGLSPAVSAGIRELVDAGRFDGDRRYDLYGFLAGRSPCLEETG